MVIDNFHGPFALTTETVEMQLGKVVSAGVMVLGKFRSRTSFDVLKVDRSDSHIRARLWAMIGSFPYFYFKLCASADEAFAMQCKMFHQLKPTCGCHPEQPEHSHVECPYCASPSKSNSRSDVA